MVGKCPYVADVELEMQRNLETFSRSMLTVNSEDIFEPHSVQHKV